MKNLWWNACSCQATRCQPKLIAKISGHWNRFGFVSFCLVSFFACFILFSFISFLNKNSKDLNTIVVICRTWRNCNLGAFQGRWQLSPGDNHKIRQASSFLACAIQESLHSKHRLQTPPPLSLCLYYSPALSTLLWPVSGQMSELCILELCVWE